VGDTIKRQGNVVMAWDKEPTDDERSSIEGCLTWRGCCRISQRNASRSSEICCEGIPKRAATSAGEYPSEIGRTIVRNVSLLAGDKIDQFTEAAVGVVVEGEENDVLVVAAVSEADAVRVDDLVVTEPAVEKRREASPARRLEPGVELEVEDPGSSEEEGHCVLMVTLFERSAPATQAIVQSLAA
jgi:hypothetical protein